MKNLRNNLYPFLLFLVCAVLLFDYLSYWKLLFMRPQGIHFMRQTDSLSFISHYLKSGMHFFKPGVMCLDGTDGKAASEFPLIYYLVAWSYTIFGRHEWLLKAINIFLVFAGFYGVFRMFLSLLKDYLFALGACFLLFCSLVVFYYTDNYLPDTSALGFSLTGLALFTSFLYDRSKKKQGSAGMVLMLLASLIKVSFFVYPLACLLTLCAYDLFMLKQTAGSVIRKNKALVIIFVAGVISVISWTIYVKHYNTIHFSRYFLVRPLSYLHADASQRRVVWLHITEWWAEAYYPALTRWLLACIALISLPVLKHADKRRLFMAGFSLAGSAAFLFLFFIQYQSHDYYFLVFVPTFVICLLCILDAFKNCFTQGTMSLLKIAVCMAAITGTLDTQEKMWLRYAESRNDPYSVLGQQLDGADKLLDECGVSRDARLIFVIDESVNGGGYFTDRFGWPVSDTTAEKIGRINELIDEESADYILVTDSGYLNNPVLASRTGKAVLTTERFSVYETK